MIDERMGTVSRAMAVLAVIAEADDDVAIIDLAASLSLPQSTCHRLLDLLANDGFVERDPKLRRYRAGPNLQRIAALVANRIDMAALAAPIMEQLTAASGETSVLARYDAAEHAIFFVAMIDAPNPLRYRIQLFEPKPITLGASGRAVAAWLTPEEIEVVYSKFLDQSESFSAFQSKLKSIHKRGFAVSRGEKLEGAVGISAPVFGVGGKVLGSLSLTIPEQRSDDSRQDEFGEKVRSAALDVSRLLGYISGVSDK